MLASTILFAASLASAASLPKRAQLSSSTGVRFKVSVKPSSPSDLLSVDSLFLNGIHVGAGQNIATFSNDGMIFYLNATSSCNPTFVNSWPPYVINWGGADTSNVVTISGGASTSGVSLVQVDGDVIKLGPGALAVCHQPLDYYHGQVYTVLKHFDTAAEIPTDCATVDITPVCAQLPALPPAGMAITREPQDIKCYTA